MTNPERPLTAKGDRYQSNKAVAWMVTRALLGRPFGLVELERAYKAGEFSRGDFQEFCQLAGYKLDAYRALFPLDSTTTAPVDEPKVP